MKSLQQIVGARVRKFRKANKYSIEELADLAGMNPAHVAKIERGELNFTMSSLEKLLDALDISYAEFFQFDEPVQESDDPLINKTTNYMKQLCIEEKQHLYRTAELFYSRRDRDE